MSAIAPSLAASGERTAVAGYWWMLAAAGYLLNSLFDGNADELRRELVDAGLVAKTQVAMLVGIVGVIGLVGSIPAGYLCDRNVRQRLLVIALLMQGIASALYPLEQLGVMMLAAVLAKLADLLFLPLLIILVADRTFPAKGIAIAVIPASGLLGGIAMNVLYQISPAETELDLTFVVVGVVSLALAAFGLYRSGRDAPSPPIDEAGSEARMHWAVMLNLLAACALANMLQSALLRHAQSQLYRAAELPFDTLPLWLEGWIVPTSLLLVAGMLLGAGVARYQPRWLIAYLGLAVAIGGISAVAGTLLTELSEEEPTALAFGIADGGASAAAFLFYFVILHWCPNGRRGLAVGIALTAHAVVSVNGGLLITLLGSRPEMPSIILGVGAAIVAWALLHVGLAQYFAMRTRGPSEPQVGPGVV